MKRGFSGPIQHLFQRQPERLVLLRPALGRPLHAAARPTRFGRQMAHAQQRVDVALVIDAAVLVQQRAARARHSAARP